MTLLEVRDVTVQFGGVTALNRVSITAAVGEITGVIGPNGAGKTTLFDVITGLRSPTSGSVTLDGRDLTSLSPHRRARLGLSRTFQSLQLFGTLTVADNVALGAPRRRSDESPRDCAHRLLDSLGLSSLADVPAHDVPTGQARLVELGRALATRPRMLLLDEPASGQDPAETHRFGEILQRLAADGIGIVMVEHDIPLVMEVCSHIHVLDFGQRIANGTPDDVRGNDSVIAAYLGADG